MMWEILYVGNMQFPKIEAGQNKFNYLGINIVAFLLTHGGQDSAENKCQRGFVGSIFVMPRRQWNWYKLFEKLIFSGYWKNVKYFFSYGC